MTLGGTKMGLFDKIKEEASSVIGNEKLGEMDKKEEKKKKGGKGKKKGANKKATKKRGAKKADPKELLKKAPVKEEEIDEISAMIPSFDGEDDIDPSNYITTDVIGGRSRSMILNQLNIPDNEIAISEDLVTPEQIENTEFTMTVPSGLDVKEVDAFCVIMEKEVKKYRAALRKAHKEKELLIDEIVRCDAAALEQRNQNVLDTVLSQKNNEKNDLSDQLINAHRENNQLRDKLKSLEANKTTSLPSIDSQSLKAENERLHEQLNKLNQEIALMKAEKEQSALVKKEKENVETQPEAKSEDKKASKKSNMKEIKEEPVKETEVIFETQSKDIEKTEKTNTSASNQTQKHKVAEADKSSIMDIEEFTNSISGSGEEYEKEVLKQINKNFGGEKPKRVKSTLTPEDILRIQQAEAEAGRVEPTAESSSTFDQMLADYQ